MKRVFVGKVQKHAIVARKEISSALDFYTKKGMKDRMLFSDIGTAYLNEAVSIQMKMYNFLAYQNQAYDKYADSKKGYTVDENAMMNDILPALRSFDVLDVYENIFYRNKNNSDFELHILIKLFVDLIIADLKKELDLTFVNLSPFALEQFIKLYLRKKMRVTFLVDFDNSENLVRDVHRKYYKKYKDRVTFLSDSDLTEKANDNKKQFEKQDSEERHAVFVGTGLEETKQISILKNLLEDNDSILCFLSASFFRASGFFEILKKSDCNIVWFFNVADCDLIYDGKEIVVACIKKEKYCPDNLLYSFRYYKGTKKFTVYDLQSTLTSSEIFSKNNTLTFLTESFLNRLSGSYCINSDGIIFDEKKNKAVKKGYERATEYKFSKEISIFYHSWQSCMKFSFRSIEANLRNGKETYSIKTEKKYSDDELIIFIEEELVWKEKMYDAICYELNSAYAHRLDFLSLKTSYYLLRNEIFKNKKEKQIPEEEILLRELLKDSQVADLCCATLTYSNIAQPLKKVFEKFESEEEQQRRFWNAFKNLLGFLKEKFSWEDIPIEKYLDNYAFPIVNKKVEQVKRNVKKNHFERSLNEKIMATVYKKIFGE